MPDDTPRGSGLHAVALLAGTGIGVLPVNPAHGAESAANTPANRDALEQLTVFGQKDAYTLSTSGLLKLAVPLIDVAQSINTVSAQEIQELSRSLRENPSQILYQPPERGVEIAR